MNVVPAGWLGNRRARCAAVLVCGALLTGIGGATCRPGSPNPPPAGLRDKYLQPFASDSIWNMPIGSSAHYVDARIGRVGNTTIDEEYWVVTDESMSVRPFFTNRNFGPGRCETTVYQYDLPVPDNLVIPDATERSTPNNPAAFLLPDGRTIRQMNPVARCEPGGPLTAGFPAATVDIYGDGILGGHGGSHLSSIGGSIRLGELTDSEPIRHALKVNLDAHRFLSREFNGFRWPATAADYSALYPPEDGRSYNGPEPALRMGALLAIPAWVNLDSLDLQTEPARKLAWTLQQYGAYVVDSTAWDAHALDVQVGVREDFRLRYRMDIEADSGPWYEDMMTLFSELQVVDNNAPGAVGGGGAPLQPLAPPIGN